MLQYPVKLHIINIRKELIDNEESQKNDDLRVDIHADRRNDKLS